MAENTTLIEIVDNSRDGITFSIYGHKIDKILSNKEDIISALDLLKEKLTEERFPFNPGNRANVRGTKANR